ncbi:XrtA/PEP-CTERM system TPR-repeat protein PrsT [Janthinobacterium psychrotolerans]|uniref:Putative PEP-CTERM system TPR-repeat lipoprotein n=1 Tax=Janthinobacterium psychrotolerans TaxID=1747903 RepID=A0A1A7C091_9BURK|nr:XrtA/PEP-CTERM system TPR-repeat protein PrsT [Janthinobacterium psychrotolerans]OBV37748.1 putative PEP-CTERM system TPR-repeat lipoprotein [Janthinobacterium psychrotolerans]
MRNTRPVISIAMLSLCSALLLACNGGQSSASLLADAQLYQQKGEPRAAIIQLKNLLQKEPDNARARLLLGSIYLDTGDALSAEKELRKAQTLGAAAADVLPLLGKAWLMAGQVDRVLKELPGDPAQPAAVLALRGDALLALGRRDEARTLFAAMQQREPGQTDALLGLARLSALEGQIAAAQLLIEQALKGKPDNLEALRLQGDVQRLQGNSSAARLAYQQILKLKPDQVQARIDLANLDITENKFADAAAQLASARKSAPGSLGVLQAQALLDFRQGKFKAALENLQLVLKAAPEHMPALLLAGAVQLALGSPQPAENYLQPFLAAHPKHLYATKMMASIEMGRGKTDAAIDLLQPLLVAFPDDVELLSLAGEAHLRARHYDKASGYFEKASLLAPNTSKLHAALGVSRLGQGESARAVSELERASLLDDKTPQAGTMLVMTLLRNKDNARALAAVQAMEKQHGSNPLVLNLKGGVYLALGDLRAARASFEQALAIDGRYLPALTNLAQIDMAEKQPERAKQRYEAALAKDKKNPDIAAALAKLAASQGKLAEAQRWLEKAHADQPDAVAPALLLSNFYLQTGATDKALALARTLQVGHPDDSDALALRAQVEYSAGEARAALDSYNKLATVQTTSAPLQMRISSLHLALGDTNNALQAARRAQAIDPALLDAQVVEVALLLDLKRPRDALAVARKVQQQQPKLAAGYKLEADVLMAQQQPREAIRLYEQAFQISRIGPLQVQLYRASVAAGMEQQADTRIGTWLREHPEDKATRLYLAGAKLKAKQYRAAIAHYQQVVANDPGNVVALNDLAWAYLQDKDSRALATAEQAHQLAPDNPAVLDTFGWIALEQGDTKRATELLRRAASLAPNAAEIQYHLAAALARTGDKPAARKRLEQLLAANKDFAQRAEAQALLARL